jgi:hypothetical protein
MIYPFKYRANEGKYRARGARKTFFSRDAYRDSKEG